MSTIKRPALYYDASMRRALKRPKETLVEIMTRFDRPSAIHVALSKPTAIERLRLCRGEVVARQAVMNYGYIWGLHSTYIFDEAGGLWYEICNKRPEQRVISARTSSFTFSEVDKVKDHYYYDGSVKDILHALLRCGWTILP